MSDEAHLLQRVIEEPHEAERWLLLADLWLDAGLAKGNVLAHAVRANFQRFFQSQGREILAGAQRAQFEKQLDAQFLDVARARRRKQTDGFPHRLTWLDGFVDGLVPNIYVTPNEVRAWLNNHELHTATVLDAMLWAPNHHYQGHAWLWTHGPRTLREMRGPIAFVDAVMKAQTEAPRSPQRLHITHTAVPLESCFGAQAVNVGTGGWISNEHRDAWMLSLVADSNWSGVGRVELTCHQERYGGTNSLTPELLQSAAKALSHRALEQRVAFSCHELYAPGDVLHQRRGVAVAFELLPKARWVALEPLMPHEVDAVEAVWRQVFT